MKSRCAKRTRTSTSKHVGAAFPQDPMRQLELAIEAVFKSWNASRAKRYRAKINEITGLRGTAVNVQTMVFGNMGDDSGTGVAFTRDPSTGRRQVLRRISRQRAGRGCCGRHSNAPAGQGNVAVESRRVCTPG